ncbi:PhnD/SsuA/transferrin family substrate-binding protein [Vibrio parahaemolyticus]|uniref:sensor histidine kinase n=1 Tax=Vibrio parahaemolyticus TaxID=670 RepID=UPI0004133914|nr:sensor histidine kinase [Vibrio parahaemolyticus]MBE4469832.1 sensor histidine kinase [Vibrio parahaemolyticus]MEA5296549.1 PhnD/SsuA/transferrin family substrate-binding protein [Vibrio parahaemolyticus]HCG8094314.1 sensor histidine kinase [Vibrio parahaemolyticus]HCH6157724.1 sensor histidine kinase [Vibrio parahaemolyticus]
MNKTPRLLQFWILCLVVFASLAQGSVSEQEYLQEMQEQKAVQPEAKQKVEVGVLAIRGHLYAEQRWQPTIDWLNQQISDVYFELHPLNLDEMGEAVKFQTMDFILTNPGQAVRLGRQYALSWMATLTGRAPQNSNYSIGSALVVRANSPYQTLKDVSGFPVAAVSEKAFGGYLTLRYQIVEMGLDPNDFFADVRYLGFPIDANLYQLRDGNVEAAVVPACLLEQMQNEGLLQHGDFRVLNQQPNEHSSCAVSTPLYPNWSFAKTERGSSLLAKKIAQVLLAMPPEHPAIIAAGASGWTSPVSLLSIDKLYQALDLHPLQQPWWSEALRWLRSHQEWAWALFMFVIVLNAYHFWLEYRFSKSKQALELTSLRLKEKSEQLEHSQRVAIVGEIGSSLAHELNQPLAAIRNYSEGGLLRLAKKRPREDIVPVLEKIQGQVERADAIIQRLRTLIRKRSVDKTPCDIQALIADTIELLHFRMQKQNVAIVTSVEGEIRPLLADSVGVQQVLVNVINNAIDACALFQEKYHSSGYQGKIALHCDYQANQLSIRILDNGTGLQQDNPTQAFVSSKAEGLGLGLAICRDVMEMHGGEFLIASTTPHGCLVELVFPYQN